MPSTVGIVASGYYTSGAFSPADLSPALWLDASDSSTITESSGAISQWNDKSGNSRNFSQSTAGNKPTYVTNAYNGKACVRIAQANKQYLSSATAGWGSGFTSAEIVIVVKANSDTNNQGMWNFSSQGNSSHFTYAGTIYDNFASSTRQVVGDPTPTLTVANIYNARSASGAWSAHLNSNQLFTTATNTVSMGTGTYRLGTWVADTDATTYFDGDICEVVVFNKVLSSTDRTNLYGYLQTKWSTPLPVDYLVVAGGGGGGLNGTFWRNGGGGGAGGYRESTLTVTPGTSYTVTVGGGGAVDTNGSNSVFSSITSTGGGFGGDPAVNRAGGNGGSGGGSRNGTTVGTGTSGQGNNGGAGYDSGNGSGNFGGGGGGGASATGGAADAVSTGAGTAGVGGAGTASSISGSSVTYAGGGGGGSQDMSTGTNYYVGGGGGAGGGGSGATTGAGAASIVAATAGTANTGGGGGGGGGGYNSDFRAGQPGGSGIVIIRYPDSYAAAASTTGSPTVTVTGGYRIYKFTGSGTITF